MDNQEEITKWFTLFKRSIDSNSQLAFSKKLTVSMIDSSTMTPFSEIVDMKSFNTFQEEKINNSSLSCFIDNRTLFYDNLVGSDVVNFSVYFPLTKEKYIFTGTRIIQSNKKKVFAKVMNNKYSIYLKKLILSMLKLEESALNEEQLVDLTSSFCGYVNESVSIDDKSIKECWESLNNEEKLNYEAITPETIKIDLLKENVKDDLSKFEAQEELLTNDNFSVVYLIPFEVDYVIYPMPQVIANSRKPNFESLYKPPKKTRRFYYIYNFLNNKWLVKELNP